MKEILRMALILMVITAVSAASLSYVHNVTSAIIADREGDRTREAIKVFFPAAERVEDKAYEGVNFKAVYDGEDRFLGVLAEARARGYGGPIPYQLIISDGGEIIDIIYGSNEETVGIGKLIEEEPFISQIIGLTPADPIELGTDIDVISGATDSSRGMARSIRETMNHFAAIFMDG